MNRIILGPGLVPEGASIGHGLTTAEYDARRDIYHATPELMGELPLERQMAFHGTARRTGTPDMPPEQAGMHDKAFEDFLEQLEAMRINSGRIAMGHDCEVIELRSEPDPIAA